MISWSVFALLGGSTAVLDEIIASSSIVLLRVLFSVPERVLATECNNSLSPLYTKKVEKT
jgi:hypothetical protein